MINLKKACKNKSSAYFNRSLDFKYEILDQFGPPNDQGIFNINNHDFY